MILKDIRLRKKVIIVFIIVVNMNERNKPIKNEKNYSYKLNNIIVI
jgi:hypothetical protein